MWISSTPPSSLGVRKSSMRASATSLALAYVGLSREAGPLPLHLAVAEAVEADALAADEVRHDLLALVAQQPGERLALLDRVGGVRTGEPAVAGHQQHRSAGGTAVLLLRGRPLVSGWSTLEKLATADTARVIASAYGVDCGDPLLRLDDARGGDELHRLGDLLGRVHRPDAPAVDPQLGSHRLLLRGRLADVLLDGLLLDLRLVHGLDRLVLDQQLARRSRTAS